MFSTIIWGSVIVGGSIAYMLLDGKPAQTTKEKTHELSNEDATLEYFNNLTLEEQERYFNDNLDLRSYKDEMLTDNAWFNAKHAAEIARRTGKAFTNKNKNY